MEEIERITPTRMPDSFRFMLFQAGRQNIFNSMSGVNEMLTSIEPQDEEIDLIDSVGGYMLREFVYLYLIKKFGIHYSVQKSCRGWPKFSTT